MSIFIEEKNIQMPKNHVYSEKFTSILNGLFHGIVLLDRLGRIIEINRSGLVLLDADPKEAIGKEIDLFFPKRYKTQIADYFITCLSENKKDYGKIEIELLNSEQGKTIIELDFNQNFYDDEVEDILTIGILNDVTKRKALEAELEKQKQSKSDILEKLEKEQELNDMKSRFISIASHEFRTPLAGILSSVDLIERYFAAEGEKWNKFVHKDKIETHFGKVKKSVKNLTGTLNQFLSLSKLEEGKLEFNPEEIDLKQLLEEQIDEFQLLLKRGQTLTYNHLSDNTTVYLDSNMLRHVINNLVSNAIKYTPENKPIEISTNVLENKTEIIIKDEGFGIPEAEQKNMFRRFFRAKNVINLQGTGLGLNIVKKYVDLMNGDIDYESQENKGTTFYVTFFEVKQSNTNEQKNLRDFV